MLFIALKGYFWLLGYHVVSHVTSDWDSYHKDVNIFEDSRHNKC